jgi:hypothetical protein
MIPLIKLPAYFKWVGILVFITSFYISTAGKHTIEDVSKTELLIIQLTQLLGLLCIACAKEKTEDERVRNIRLTSLQWAVILFVIIRVSFKITAYSLKDTSYLPGEINTLVLLLLYIFLFHFQLHVFYRLIGIFKPGKNEE